MSKAEVIDWSSGYDAGYEDGVKMAFRSLEGRDPSDAEDEAWCEGFIEAWNMQAFLHPADPIEKICITCDYRSSDGCAKKDHAFIGCSDWVIMDD